MQYHAAPMANIARPIVIMLVPAIFHESIVSRRIKEDSTMTNTCVRPIAGKATRTSILLITKIYRESDIANNIIPIIIQKLNAVLRIFKI